MAETPTPNLTELMKTAKKMQESMQAAHEKLSKLKVTGRAGDDEVFAEVTVTGRHDVERVKISDSAFDEPKNVIEGLVAAATNDANRRIEQASKDEMAKLSKELGLPEDAATK